MQSLAFFSAPFVLTLISIEGLLGMWLHKAWYDRRDTWANIALGAFGFVLGLLMKVVTFAIFSWFHQFAFRSPGNSVLEFLACFVVSDFIAYCFHRLGHEVAAFWAVHSTHHTSEKMNFSVGLRFPFHHAFRFIFWIPMAFFFSPEMMVITESISLLYQFLLHTESVRSLGPLEWILNTPSHHRVHHASNPQYIDKNYGGTLIIFDRLLGTFAKEEEPCVYGTAEPFHSHNPAEILFHGWVDLYRRMRAAGSLRGAVRTLLGRPYGG